MEPFWLMFVGVGQSCLVFHYEVRCEAQSMIGCIISDQNFAQKLIAHSPLHSGAVNQHLPTGQEPPKIAHRRSSQYTQRVETPIGRWECGCFSRAFPPMASRRMAPSVIRLCFLCSPRDWHLGELGVNTLGSLKPFHNQVTVVVIQKTFHLGGFIQLYTTNAFLKESARNRMHWNRRTNPLPRSYSEKTGGPSNLQGYYYHQRQMQRIGYGKTVELQCPTIRRFGPRGAWDVRFSIGRCLGCYIELCGGFRYLLFSPLPWGNDPIWLYNIFTKGLVPPPTSEYPTM